MRILSAAIAGLSLAIAAAPADAACNRNCLTLAEHKPSSVIPSENSFTRFGDLFQPEYAAFDLRNDGIATVNLGFTLRIGSFGFNSVQLSENGYLTFAAPAAGQAATAAFTPLRSLADFGGPIIAPFYANLAGTDSTRPPRVGQVIVQYGFADPTPDANGRYSQNDLLQAVRITWYGLGVADAPATNVPRAFAQVLFTNEGNGDFNFEFRSGDPGANNGAGPFSQEGYGSIAGFSLFGTTVDFAGPYDGIGEPSYFVFRDGAFESPVPEPATWAMMIAGLGLAGAASRRRRRMAPVRA